MADLVEEGTVGRLRIPPFQRAFRWDARDIERLFDSIWNSYPVGSLLLWRRPGQAAPAASLAMGPVRIDAPETDDALWVVDGQQRLVSLVGVLAARGDRTPGDKFDLHFDLASRTFRRRSRERAPITWLPLRGLLETDFFDWVLKFRDEEGSQEHVELAQQLAKRVRDFTLPASIVTTDDETVVRDIFDRVNGFGHRLKRAEVFHALHAAFGNERPGSIREVADQVEMLGFGRLADDTILRSVLAVRSGDVYRDLHKEFDDGSLDREETLRAASLAMERAVAFLREAGIPHARALPYSFVVPVLVRFFHLFPESDARNRVLLRRWLWRGAIAALATKGTSTALLRQSVQAVHPDDEHGSVQRLLALSGAPAAAELDLDAVALNRGAGRMNLALLASLGPRHLVSGEPLDAGSTIDEDDGKSLLRVPHEGHRLVGRLLHPELDDDEPLGDVLAAAPPEALASHAISPAAARALSAGDIATFSAERDAALREALGAARDLLAEPNASDRPTISALVVADDV